MSVINILDPHVADLIAAGEVVERPASVIKELLENAFDAGAQNVTVELRGGGATYIRVTDDGCGMAPEDAGVAFLRHATSKLRDERGLEAIGTMGFRGEALAAISAVSHIELRTRRRGDTEGTRVTLTAGEIDEMGAVGCPEGTTMIVRDLFYNTPARLKFLKSDRSEASACVQTALRCALGRPEVSVRLIRDGSEEFFSPGDGRQDSCVYALLGRDLASSLLPCRGEDEGLRVSGFVSSPSAGRGNRGAQYFFCNGRFIKSQLLQAALEQAYKNSLLSGRYPACALYLELSSLRPAGGGSARRAARRPRIRACARTRTRAAEARAGQAGFLPQHERRPVSRRPARGEPPDGEFFLWRDESACPGNAGADPAGSVACPDFDPFRRKSPGGDRLCARSGAPNCGKLCSKCGEVPCPRPQDTGGGKTYILVEVGEQLLLIDKHAAHERMNFDRLKAMDREILSQTLLAPVTLRPDAGDCELLEQNGELFHELGFEIEPFGRGAYILRAVPADILPGDAVPAIEEMLEKLRRGKAPDVQSVKDELLHTVACKAAIKAGWDTSRAELERIVQEVLSGRVKYCPHGRPVSAVLSKKDLEKMFKRIV